MSLSRCVEVGLLALVAASALPISVLAQPAPHNAAVPRNDGAAQASGPASAIIALPKSADGSSQQGKGPNSSVPAGQGAPAAGSAPVRQGD